MTRITHRQLAQAVLGTGQGEGQARMPDPWGVVELLIQNEKTEMSCVPKSKEF